MELDGITFQSGGMKDLRLLPVTTLPTNIAEGTLVNHNGEWKRFTGVAGTWERATFKPGTLMWRLEENSIPAMREWFGIALEANSTHILIGGHGADATDSTGAAQDTAGAAQIYDINTGELVHYLVNPYPEVNFFGAYVCMSESYAVVSHHSYESGAVHVYDITTGALLRTISPGIGGFSQKTSTDGDYIISGYGNITISGKVNAGYAHIYSASTGALVRQLVNPNVVAEQKFGADVSVSGNYAAVGAIGYTASYPNAGAVHIFNITTGALERTITEPTRATGNGFGSSVSLHGNYCIINNGRNTTTQDVYVFDITTGVLVSTLINPGVSYFGYGGSSISGDYAVVGSYNSVSIGGSTTGGNAYVFNILTGALVHSIPNPTPVLSDNFGRNVSLSGNNVVISADGDGQDNWDTGRVYVYDRTTGTLEHTLSTTGRKGSNLGHSVAIHNNVAIVGLPKAYAVYNYVSSSGAVNLYDVTTGNRLLTIANPFPLATTTFGWSVAINGNYCAVGDDSYTINSGGAKTYAGRVYFFDVTTGDLIRILEPSPVIATDRFGQKILMDDTYTYISSPRHNNGFFYGGIIDVYNTATGAWVREINSPVAASQSYFGLKMSLSGNNLIVGVREIDTACIMDATTGALLHTLTSAGSVYFGEEVAIGGNYAIVDDPYIVNGNGSTGKLHVYNVTTGALLYTVEHPEATGKSFGLGGISIEGNLAIIGSYLDDIPGLTGGGRVYLLQLDTGVITSEISNPAPETNGSFGFSSAIHGGHCIIGAPYKNHSITTTSDSGEAYIYKLA